MNPNGRPLGRKDMHGRARRVASSEVPRYFVILGQRVRDARLERDVSMVELAAAIGSNQHHIARLERGNVRRGEVGNYGPSTGMVIRIALALGVSPSELMP